MIKQMMAVAAAMLSLSPVAQAVDNPAITAELRYFKPSMDFKVTSSSIQTHDLNGNFRSNTLDFTNDFGTSADAGPELRLGVGDHWQFSYMKTESSGSGMPDFSFKINSTSFGRVMTQAKVSLTYYRLAYKQAWHEDARTKAYWLADLKSIRIKASAQEAPFGVLGKKETKEKTATVPSIGAGFVSTLDDSGRFKANAEFSFLPAGKYGSSYDLEAGLRYQVGDRFDVLAGYRIIRIKADTDGEQADLSLKGPFFGINGTF